MITNNFLSMLKYATNTSYGQVVIHDGNLRKCDTDQEKTPNAWGITPSGISTLHHPSETNRQRCFVMFFGNGDSETTSDSYTLDNYVTNWTYQSSYVAITGTYSNILYTASTTIKNGGTEPITISELGLFFAGWQGCYMVAREVITPVTIAPNDSYRFTMNIEI